MSSRTGNPRRTLVTLGALSSLTIALAACSSGSTGTTAGGETTVAGETADVSISTAFYPLAWVAEQVGGDRVTVTDLTPTGTDEHDLELSPAAVDAMRSDELIVYLAGFQPAMDSAVETLGGESGTEVYDVSGDVDLQPAVGDHDHADHGKGDGHDHDHNHDEDDDHDHGEGLAGMDPHFWLDPDRLAVVATQVGERLAEIDPDGAQTYRDNAQATVDTLTTLGDDIDAGLQPCTNSSIIVTHEAYGYLTEPHGITMIGIAGIDPDTEPSPARIAEIEKAAAESDATTVFGEEAVDQRIAQTIADQTGLTYGVLDPLGSKVSEDATYPGQMEKNLEALRSALACA